MPIPTGPGCAPGCCPDVSTWSGPPPAASWRADSPWVLGPRAAGQLTGGAAVSEGRGARGPRRSQQHRRRSDPEGRGRGRSTTSVPARPDTSARAAAPAGGRPRAGAGRTRRAPAPAPVRPAVSRAPPGGPSQALLPATASQGASRPAALRCLGRARAGPAARFASSSDGTRGEKGAIATWWYARSAEPSRAVLALPARLPSTAAATPEPSGSADSSRRSRTRGAPRNASVPVTSPCSVCCGVRKPGRSPRRHEMAQQPHTPSGRRSSGCVDARRVQATEQALVRIPGDG